MKVAADLSLEALNGGQRDVVDQQWPEETWEDAMLVYPGFKLAWQP